MKLRIKISMEKLNKTKSTKNKTIAKNNKSQLDREERFYQLVKDTLLPIIKMSGLNDVGIQVLFSWHPKDMVQARCSGSNATSNRTRLSHRRWKNGSCEGCKGYMHTMGSKILENNNVSSCAALLISSP